MRAHTINPARLAPLDLKRRLSISLLAVPLIVLAIFAPWISGAGTPLICFLVAGQLAVCSLGVVRSFSSGTRPVSLVYFMFSFAWLGIGPAYQLSHDRMAWRDYTILANEELIVRALVLNVLASTAFLFGSELQRRRGGSAKAPVLAATARIRDNGRFLWFYLGACVLLTPFAVGAAGGLGTMFASRAARSSALGSAGLSLAQAGGLQVALVTILPSALAVASSLLATIRLRERAAQEAVRLSDVLAFTIGLALLILFCNPLANSRFITILAFGSLAIVLFRPLSVRAGQRFALVALLGTAIVYPLAEVFRHGFDAATSLRTGTQAFASMDFDGFQQLANGVVYADDFGFSKGHYTASALLYFVPRSIWEGKATPASLDVAANRGYSFTNLSLPFPAEMYIEFGAIGMAIILLALGYFCSKADGTWLQGGVTKLGVLVPVMAVSVLGFIRGPLGSLAPVYLTAILLVFLALTSSHRTPINPRQHTDERSQKGASQASA